MWRALQGRPRCALVPSTRHSTPGRWGSPPLNVPACVCAHGCCASNTAVAQRSARAPTGRGAAACARSEAAGGGRSPCAGDPGDPRLRPGQEPPPPPRKVTQPACPQTGRGCGRRLRSRFPLPEMASQGRSGPAAVTARSGPIAEETRCGETSGLPPARSPAGPRCESLRREHLLSSSWAAAAMLPAGEGGEAA